jgi:hypothetical protein
LPEWRISTYTNSHTPFDFSRVSEASPRVLATIDFNLVARRYEEKASRVQEGSSFLGYLAEGFTRCVWDVYRPWDV